MKNRQSIIQAIKFFLFSCSAGIIETLSFALFDTFLHFSYWPSYLFALLLSIVWNFTLNKKYTFKSTVEIPKAMIKVLCYYAIFTPVSTYLGQIWADHGANHYLILFITMVLNLITEFLFDKYIVFKENNN